MSDTWPDVEWLQAECTRLSVACMELEGAYNDALAERDRLRAAVDAVIAYRTVMGDRVENVNNPPIDFAAEVELADQAHRLFQEMDERLADVVADVWHCRCGKRYPAHRHTCPSCGQPRVTS